MSCDDVASTAMVFLSECCERERERDVESINQQRMLNDKSGDMIAGPGRFKTILVALPSSYHALIFTTQIIHETSANAKERSKQIQRCASMNDREGLPPSMSCIVAVEAE